MKADYKYHKLLKPQEFGFLEYYMLPEKNQFDYVYRPGDDSFLMLSVLKQELPSFPQNPIICEIGSGSGILSAHVNYWLKESNPPLIHLATDISLDACILSQKYYSEYNLQIDQVCTSLFSSIEKLRPNVIIFNPPYVPTETEEKQNEIKYLQAKLKEVRENHNPERNPNRNLIAFSYMGGPDGLETTRKLLSLIKWETKLYFIVMGEEGLEKLQQQLPSLICGELQSKVEVLQYYQKQNEELYVVLLTAVKKQ